MSIINDALKKVQSAPQSSVPETAPVSPQPSAPVQPSGAPAPDAKATEAEPKAAPQKKERRSDLILIIGIICAMIGLFVPFAGGKPFIVTILNSFKKNPAPAARRTHQPNVIQNIMAAIPTGSNPPSSASKNEPSSLFNFSKPAARILTGSVELNGIMTANGQNVALIGEQIYEEGQTFQGRQIVRIEQDSIVLRGADGQEQVIKVSGR